MAAIVYPASLPGPTAAPIQSAERRNVSPLDGPRTTAVGQRDRLATQQVAFVFTFAEAAVFRAWWKDTLIYGGAWFAATWPLPQGLVVGVRKFLGTPKWSEYLPNVGWRVTAVCEVRGRGELPMAFDPPGGFVSAGKGGGAGGSGGSVADPGGETPSAAVGDLINLFILSNGVLVVPEGFTLQGSKTESSNSFTLRWLTRVADGTAADAPTNFAFTSDGVEYVYVYAVFRHVLLLMDASIQPWGGATYDPPSITFGGGDPCINVSLGMCFAVDNGFELVGVPSGYSLLGDASHHYVFTNPESGGQIDDFIQILAGYSVNSEATEDPSTFTSTGSQVSGGAGSVTIRMTYAP